MAWVLLNPVSWVLRPAMLPIVGGLGGLFYGSYDLTLLTIGTLTGVKPAHKCTFSHKASTFDGGLGVSGGALYVRWLFDPPPLVPKIEEEVAKGVANSLQRTMRQSVQMIRFFPYAWYCSSVAFAGVVTGVTVSLTR